MMIIDGISWLLLSLALAFLTPHTTCNSAAAYLATIPNGIRSGKLTCWPNNNSSWQTNGRKKSVGGANNIRRGDQIHKSLSSLKIKSINQSQQNSSWSTTNTFLGQIEETIQNVTTALNVDFHDAGTKTLVHLPIHERESAGVAKILSHRLHSQFYTNHDCPRCWLQRAHCICSQTPPIVVVSSPKQEEEHEHENVLLPKNLNRLFVIMHHKEIGLVVDTAKLLLNSLTSFDVDNDGNECGEKKARLVVSGIGEEYQDSMRELKDAMKDQGDDTKYNHKDGTTTTIKRRCIVLFPSEDAKTFQELQSSYTSENNIHTHSEQEDSSQELVDKGPHQSQKDEKGNKEVMYDVIVMDGTWSQARKIHSKYIPLEKDGGPPRVCLSQASLDILGGTTQDKDAHDDVAEAEYNTSEKKSNNGRQLRRHPIKWREVSTLEATRLLFRDMMEMNNCATDGEGKFCYEILREYQQISDAAAIKQLGPPRQKIK